MISLNNKTLFLKIAKYFLSFLLFFIFKVLSVQAEQVTTQKISAEPLVEVINRIGEVGFKRTIDLSFKSNGYLEELSVDEGDYFSKGQLLAKLNDTELIAEKNASYARLLQAKRQVERIKALLNKKLSSQQALDDAQTLIQIRQANFNVAQYKLSRVKIIAPFDGVVVKRYSSLEELQTLNKTVLSIARLTNNAIVSIALTAEQMSIISRQQKAIVDVIKLGKITATVAKIPARADSLSHLFSVDFLLNDININKINIGSLAEVKVKVITKILVYKLPIEALNGIDEQDRALVVISENNSNVLKSYRQRAFDIRKISNQYIYLLAQQGASPINVVDNGWQKLIHKK